MYIYMYIYIHFFLWSKMCHRKLGFLFFFSYQTLGKCDFLECNPRESFNCKTRVIFHLAFPFTHITYTINDLIFQKPQMRFVNITYYMKKKKIIIKFSLTLMANRVALLPHSSWRLDYVRLSWCHMVSACSQSHFWGTQWAKRISH